MMSSNVRAPGKNRPCLARNSVASGSPPPIRSRISSLRSRTISRLAARSSGLIVRIASDIPCDELIEDLALEPLDQLIEAFARVRLEEVVVLQAADPLPDVRREAVELVEPAGGDVAEHSGGRSRRLVGGGGRHWAWRASSAVASATVRSVRDASSSRRSTPARSSATISSSSRRMSPRTSLSW